jgi:uncharacterized protein
MEYFFYGRDRPGVLDLRRQTMEAHWSFMDGYGEVMIARGPTLAPDDDQFMTGSLHLVDLPDAEAAHVFAYEEPFFKAGVFAEVLVRRWSNLLGRTMWDFTGVGGRRFMILGHGDPTMTDAAEKLQEQQLEYMTGGERSDALIAYGPLHSEADSGWLGTVALVERPDRPATEAMMNGSPYARAGLYTAVEIHNWRFGGRPPA